MVKINNYMLSKPFYKVVYWIGVVTFVTAIFILTTQSCTAQEFDRTLEKGIKTEINLNRIMVSRSPLTVSSYLKARADSLCQSYCQQYVGSRQETSKEIRSDFNKMHESLEQEMNKDNTVAYNFFVVHQEEDYATVIKAMIRDSSAYFYKIYHSQISLSAVRYNNDIFVTVISW